ncbi:DUF1631 family protein [Marinimicrobium sp. ABcell2]|uniref:DUF1631 family protein n=1 Tax=Marinimicrobium sp. ABcell2 TaxID=3069751 RepID=UPI0027B68432|nr:DUF1631 family protein [Marinimicrobium sp. ABcell2]MDQ2076304.1 DUF1631 family protein [Marinimicrobium sp. ABcell2]
MTRSRDADQPGAPQAPTPHQVQPLSQQQIARCLMHCRELTVDYARHVFPGFWRSWCELLDDYAERARSNREQTALYEVRRNLAESRKSVEEEFSQRLSNGYTKFRNKMLNTLTGEERFSGDMLSLVEHSDLEETIAITSITHRADSLFAGQLWALQQRLALLSDGEKPDERSNPASPVQFCEALRRSLASLELDNKSKIIGYKTFDRELIGHLDELYEQINGYLIDEGVLPNLRYAAVVDDSGPVEDVSAGQEAAPDEGSTEPQAVPQRRASDRLLSGVGSSADNQYQTGLFNAIRLLQSHMAQYAGAPVSGAGDVDAEPTIGGTPYHSGLRQAYSSQQWVDVLQSLQVQALDVSSQAVQSGGELMPSSVQEVSQQMLARITADDDEGQVDAADMETIDLVGLLFEYMLSDDNLPDSVKTLLSYLHTPFLKIAFIDKGFFEQTEHPARVLLNSLAEAGSRWVSNDGTCQYDMYDKIKATVFRILGEFENDVRLFAEVLLEFNGYTHNLARRQELIERRALEKVQGEEKLREAKQRVNDEVIQRTDGRELPSAVLLLLLQPWSDYLSFVLLRYGDRSESWTGALNLIEELLWTLEPKLLEHDKSRQLEIQDDVLAGLERGFDTIGYEQAKGRKLLDAIRSLQKMALQSRKAAPAPAPMRSKLESMAAERAGRGEGVDEPVTPEEQKIVDTLKLIEFGTWFEYEGGRRLKVSWYNKRTLHYMLVDQKGRKMAMNSGLQLARDMIAGKARVIHGSTKPFFERALENIYQQLNSRVSSKIEDGNDH